MLFYTKLLSASFLEVEVTDKLELEALEKPVLADRLEDARWSEIAREDYFGTVCDRARTYWDVVAFYYVHIIKLLSPVSLMEFLWCFYKAKREAHVAWQMVDSLSRSLRERERDILVSVFRARLICFFGKPKRAKRIEEMYSKYE